MRTALVPNVMVLCLGLAPLVAQSAPPVRLDEEALLSLSRTNADHFRRATAILTAARELPCQNEQFGRVMSATYQARDAHCQLALLTSSPPKRMLSFRLDRTDYVATIVVKDDSKLIPAQAEAQVNSTRSGAKATPGR